MKGHKIVRTTHKVCTLLLCIPLVVTFLPVVWLYAGLVNFLHWAKYEWQRLSMSEAEQKLMKHKLMESYAVSFKRKDRTHER